MRLAADLKRNSGLSYIFPSIPFFLIHLPFPLLPSSPSSSHSSPLHNVFFNRACSDIAITPGGDQKLNSGVFDFGFGNDLGSSWSKPDPVGKDHLLHQEGWSPISAPLNLLSSPLFPSLPQPPPVLSSWPSTSLKPPDPPRWLVQQTFLPITSNQVEMLLSPLDSMTSITTSTL